MENSPYIDMGHMVGIGEDAFKTPPDLEMYNDVLTEQYGVRE
jgi:hypothetical protein